MQQIYCKNFKCIVHYGEGDSVIREQEIFWGKRYNYSNYSHNYSNYNYTINSSKVLFLYLNSMQNGTFHIGIFIIFHWHLCIIQHSHSFHFCALVPLQIRLYWVASFLFFKPSFIGYFCGPYFMFTWLKFYVFLSIAAIK